MTGASQRRVRERAECRAAAGAPILWKMFV